MVVWLYGALVLTERRSGYIITLIGSLLAFGVAILHMKGKGVGVASGVIRASGRFPLRLDAACAWRDRALLVRALGARTVELAMAPAAVARTLCPNCCPGSGQFQPRVRSFDNSKEN